tara:strand:+ start:536 stop:1495 length:960 start_codon:yes stop_codon:yes gene_type:complete
VYFVASAFNEKENIFNLYNRCLTAFEALNKKLDNYSLIFNMILIDNNSSDSTNAEICSIINHDQRVLGYKNLKTYTAEKSTAYGIKLAYSFNADCIISMCSDLQDPPEIAIEMLDKLLLENHSFDSVLAVKTLSSGNIFIRIMRSLYYIVLRFSDRDSNLVIGFHGFACFYREVCSDVIWYLDNTNLNLRNSMMMASQKPKLYSYKQSKREYGKSSYSFLGYVREAIDAIQRGKSFAPRISLRLGLLLSIITILLSLFVILNTLFWGGGYAGGVPTLSIIMMLGFSTQAILLSMLSRQIENSNPQFNHIISKQITNSSL